MAKKNDLFCSYVAIVGGRANAAARLNKSASMIGHLMSGLRNVTPEIALQIDAETGGQISKARLRPDLWASHSEAA
jgi:DNA-binding transcriptional regulator YdaS (Cro superfamily)